MQRNDIYLIVRAVRKEDRCRSQPDSCVGARAGSLPTPQDALCWYPPWRQRPASPGSGPGASAPRLHRRHEELSLGGSRSADAESRPLPSFFSPVFPPDIGGGGCTALIGSHCCCLDLGKIKLMSWTLDSIFWWMPTLAARHGPSRTISEACSAGCGHRNGRRSGGAPRSSYSRLLRTSMRRSRMACMRSGRMACTARCPLGITPMTAPARSKRGNCSNTCAVSGGPRLPLARDACHVPLSSLLESLIGWIPALCCMQAVTPVSAMRRRSQHADSAPNHRHMTVVTMLARWICRQAAQQAARVAAAAVALHLDCDIGQRGAQGDGRDEARQSPTHDGHVTAVGCSLQGRAGAATCSTALACRFNWSRRRHP